MIISKTPFRISFSGGGTDIREFYKIEPGAVLSATISRYMYIFLSRRFDGNFRVCYSKTETVKKAGQIQHPIISECFDCLGENGVDMASIADIPEASGLGSSSSFAVGLTNAVSTFKGRYLDKEDLAREACRIEIEEIGEPIGKQDQYAAAFGGFNFIEFNEDETVEVKPVLCSPEIKDELNQSLMLIFTGLSGDKKAGDIIKTYDFEKRMVLKEQKELAYDMKASLENGNSLSDFGLLLGESWKMKKQMSEHITTPEIELIHSRGLDAGALSGKLCGAGGRGFFLFFVERHNRDRLRKAMKPLREIPFRFVPEGSRIIHVSQLL